MKFCPVLVKITLSVYRPSVLWVVLCDVRSSLFQNKQVWFWVPLQPIFLFVCWSVGVFVCLFVCFLVFFLKLIFQSRELGKLQQGGYKRKAGNSQSLSYKHWLTVYDYELCKLRNCDSVTRRQYLFQSVYNCLLHFLVIVKSAIHVA